MSTIAAQPVRPNSDTATTISCSRGSSRCCCARISSARRRCPSSRCRSSAACSSFGVGNIFFPISYIFGDVLTEVYGYARARRVIWAGFLAMVFASVMAWVVVNLPASPTEPFNATLQPAIEVVFGNTWRIAVASIAAFWVGDFVNAYVLARLKVADARPLALDANDRLDDRRAGRRQRDLLSARVRGHLGRPDAVRRDRVQLVLQGHGRGRHDARYLCDRRLAQAPRARGLLRHGHEFHARSR